MLGTDGLESGSFHSPRYKSGHASLSAQNQVLHTTGTHNMQILLFNQVTELPKGKKPQRETLLLPWISTRVIRSEENLEICVIVIGRSYGH